jgi:DNA repair protein RadC
MRDLKKEVFKALLLDSRNNIIAITEINEGTVTQATPIVREVISKAIQHFAAGLICVHNHPSGEPKPSKEDRDFTRELYQACKIMQINFLDHVIIGDNQYFSFVDNGELLA